jgi:hypothetical protein
MFLLVSGEGEGEREREREREANSWAQMSRFHLKTGTGFSLRKVLSNNRTIVNILNCNSYINIQLSVTYIYYLYILVNICFSIYSLSFVVGLEISYK